MFSSLINLGASIIGANAGVAANEDVINAPGGIIGLAAGSFIGMVAAESASAGIGAAVGGALGGPVGIAAGAVVGVGIGVGVGMLSGAVIGGAVSQAASATAGRRLNTLGDIRRRAEEPQPLIAVLLPDGYFLVGDKVTPFPPEGAKIYRMAPGAMPHRNGTAHQDDTSIPLRVFA